jgi:hypothetical protein
MFSNTKTLSLVALFLLFGIVIGFWVSHFLVSPLPVPPAPQPSQSSPLAKEELRIPRELIDNPVISDWQADVDGILVEKNKDNFVLESNGKRLVIDISKMPLNVDRFFDRRGNQRKPIHYEDIPLGVRMQGVTSINPQTSKEVTADFIFDIVPQDFQ